MTIKKQPLHFNSDRLQAIIEVQNKSISQVAESIGVSRTILYKWMNGEWVPKLQSILAMCDYFEVEIGYFFPTGKRLKHEPTLV